MKLLFDYDLKNYNPLWNISERPSARGIIFSKDNKIALVHSKKYNYYKFPGGGIHEDEDKVTAMIREVQEETGLKVIPSTVQEYGYVKRVQKSKVLKETVFLQYSYYYKCEVEEELVSQKLDDYEKEAEFELKFVTLEEAIKANKEFDNDEFSVVMTGRDTIVMEMLLGVDSTPSLSMAHLLLNYSETQNPGLWVNHSLAVASGAKNIAEQLKKQGIKIDPEKAYIYGLLHDIGRRDGLTYLRHVYSGYHYLNKMGYKKAANICLTHSFNLHDIQDYVGKNDLTPIEYEELKELLSNAQYDNYDLLIQVLDATCGANGTINLKSRMDDVRLRYGSYPKAKWDKNFELKDYFEKLMKKDYYEVLGVHV